MPNVIEITESDQSRFAAPMAADWDPDPEPDPPAEPALPLAEWIAAQAALYRSPATLHEHPWTETEQMLELVAAALDDLAIGVRQVRATSPAEYVERARPYGGLPSLELVRVPSRRTCALADALDYEARAYLRLGTDVGALCAAAVLWLAGDAEELEAESAAGYVALCELRDEERRERLANDTAEQS